MKLIFCLLAEQGHINPYIGPAQALRLLGHEVLVASSGDISEQMKNSDLPFSRALISPEAGAAPRGKALVDLIEDRSQHRALIETVFLKGIVEQVEPMKKWLEEEAPDGVIVDPMNYAAVIAAHLLGIPWISISSSLTSVIPSDLKSDTLDIVASLAPMRAEVFGRFGFVPEFRAVDCFSPYLNITFATRDFIGHTPKDVELVGPSVALFQRGDEVELRTTPSDKLLIYVSFGSQVFYYPTIFKKIIKACETLSVHLVLSIGDLADEPEWEDKKNVQFYKYAPQLEILKRAALFITHGGANSVMEGLRAGVPLLISPLCNDQYHQAHFIEKSGVGRSLDLRIASVEEIRGMIGSVLRSENIQHSLRSLTQAYQTNGSMRAARLISRRLESNIDA